MKKSTDEYVNELISEKQNSILSYYLGDDTIIEGINIKGIAIGVAKFLAKAILIPIITILALFLLCYKLSIEAEKREKKTRKDRKNKILYRINTCRGYRVGNKTRETPRAGLEPATLRLTAECSTIELSRNVSRNTLSNFFTW